MVLKVCDSLSVLTMKMKAMQTGKGRGDALLNLTVIEKELIICKGLFSHNCILKNFEYRSIIYVNIIDLTYTLSLYNFRNYPHRNECLLGQGIVA